MHRSFSGDFEIVAHIAEFSVANISDGEKYAKVGIMIRESLDPKSPHVCALIIPDGRLIQIQRTVKNAQTSWGSWIEGTGARWLKLTRQDNSVMTFYSTNGTIWRSITNQAVNFPSTVYAGFAVCSASQVKTATAVLDHVAIKGQ